MKYILLIISLFSTQVMANQQAINTLDQFHQAASQANFEQYFAVFADGGVFMGTDGSERWTKEQFQDYVKFYFDQGKGWLYQPTSRNFTAAGNDNILLFDELLENSNYGQCRGTGVLIRSDTGWQILQYNLSIAIPNGVAKDVVSSIRQYNKRTEKQ